MTVRYFLKYHYLRESLYNEILDLLYQACWVVDDLIDCSGFSKERGKIDVDINRLDKEEVEEPTDYSEEMGELVSIFDEIFRGLHEHKNWRVALPCFN